MSGISSAFRMSVMKFCMLVHVDSLSSSLFMVAGVLLPAYIGSLNLKDSSLFLRNVQKSMLSPDSLLAK
uniref:Uncharacterized protein n=1 Tax=Pararge aegeria TaxID=116150 RepID=S4PJP4_9NEOP